MSHADTCKHYDGVIELHPVVGRKKQCMAGVEFATVMQGDSGPLWDRVPCFRKTERFPCAKREWPTANEIAEHEAKWRAILSARRRRSRCDSRSRGRCGRRRWRDQVPRVRVGAALVHDRSE